MIDEYDPIRTHLSFSIIAYYGASTKLGIGQVSSREYYLPQLESMISGISLISRAGDNKEEEADLNHSRLSSATPHRPINYF